MGKKSSLLIQSDKKEAKTQKQLLLHRSCFVCLIIDRKIISSKIKARLAAPLIGYKKRKHNTAFPFFCKIISSRIEVHDELSSSRTSFFPLREDRGLRSLPL